MLANTAAHVIGVDANPEAFEHATAKYKRVEFERTMVEIWQGDVDCVVFLQTIEHIQDPDAMLAHIRSLIEPDGVAYVSTPNVLTLALKGEERSGNPWHVREYKPEEYRELCERPLRQRRAPRPVPRAQAEGAPDRARAPELGSRAPVAAPHAPVLRALQPAINASDFTLRKGNLERSLDLLAVLRP